VLQSQERSLLRWAWREETGRLNGSPHTSSRYGSGCFPPTTLGRQCLTCGHTARVAYHTQRRVTTEAAAVSVSP
jgi:hypothetical protein